MNSTNTNTIQELKNEQIRILNKLLFGPNYLNSWIIRNNTGADSLPGHAAVDGEVEGVGEADDAVDEERDVPNKFVIKKIFINTKIQTFYIR